jgi:hypothetical protein
MEAHADRGAGPRETANGRVRVVMTVVVVLVAFVAVHRIVARGLGRFVLVEVRKAL